MYLMIETRPELAFSVGKLSQFCKSPTQDHWSAVKRLMRYVRSTLNLESAFRDLSICLVMAVVTQPGQATSRTGSQPVRKHDRGLVEQSADDLGNKQLFQCAPIKLNSLDYVGMEGRNVAFDTALECIRQMHNGNGSVQWQSQGYKACQKRVNFPLQQHEYTAFHLVRDVVLRKKWSWNINQQMRCLLMYSPNHLQVLLLRDW